jgi:hypothetical protein
MDREKDRESSAAVVRCRKPTETRTLALGDSHGERTLKNVIWHRKFKVGSSRSVAGM